MLGYIGVLCLFNLNIILVHCLLPSLAVRKISKSLVQQKRKDTLDTCNLFIRETRNLNTSRFISTVHPPLKRSKRNIDAPFLNPKTGAEKENQVESIVDKIYDELQENGTTIAYRSRRKNHGAVKNKKGKPKRRFDFAPAFIDAGDMPKKGKTTAAIPDTESVPIDWHKKWPNGIIPYFVDAKTYDSYLSDEVIGRAFDYFEKATCIRLQRLRERPTDLQSLSSVQWIYISNPNGIRQCVHSNEIQENTGVQVVVFGYDCMSMGEIVHELMHVLGFSHEHTRPDRDQYVTILWDNIKPGYKKYFEVRSIDPLKSFAYDYSSVLHYPPRSFSKNGKITIVVEPGIKLGQREGLSEIDVEKISTIFGDECLKRNKQYLLHTCPIVVKSKIEDEPVSTPDEMDNYYKNKIWPFGIINFKIRDKLEFSTEEIENIKAVIAHIERETCIEFRDLHDDHDNEKDDSDVEKENKSDDYVPANSSTKDPNSNSTNDIDDGRPNSLEESDKREAQNDIVDEGKKADGESPVDGGNPVENGSLVNEDNLDANKSDGTQEPISPSRRHANDFLVLKRTANPGCPCPPAGRPEKTGSQVIEISSGCFNSVNDLLHLFAHVLGLEHQHNSHDRDSYIKILWDELTPELSADLKVKLPPAASAGYPYDYSSIMHFPWLEIKTGKINIMYPIWNDGWVMGHWQGLSPVDVKKLNDIYGKECTKRKEAIAKS